MTRKALDDSYGLLAVCNALSSSHTSGGIRSGRCERVCPIFTATGPSSASLERKAAPRVSTPPSALGPFDHTASSSYHALTNSSSRPPNSSGRA